ncbi:Pentatricopeptide repeat-containing protein [Nymphaea thermarum]|nr:Pentatricopeptide repeat-containing protein [Nymphaea thermarum]
MPPPLHLSELVQHCVTTQHLKQIHAHLLVAGPFTDEFIINKLLRRCSQLRNVPYARQLFDEIPQPNVFLWTALIHGHVENGMYEEALLLHRSMVGVGTAPLSFTVSSVLKAALGLSQVQYGESIHGQALKFGLESDLVSANTILDFYSKSGCFDSAYRLFDLMVHRDVVSWNVMMACCWRNGELGRAKQLFDEMPERNVVSWTTMICGYIKTGDMVAARFLFSQMGHHDVASWNAMISGYVDCGDLQAAQDLLERMPGRDTRPWNLLIDAYCKVGDMKVARGLFDEMPERDVASWTMMVDGYAKIGDIGSACFLFDQMPVKNLMSWTSMLNGYTKNGEPYKALMLFKELQETGLRPDETCVLSVIPACAQLGTLNIAEKIVQDYVGSGPWSNLQLVTCIIDMYSRCGSIGKAFQVFRETSKKDLVCYSAMITAFAHHGMVHDAIQLFEEMLREDIKPDEIIFIGILTACSHAGLVDEGRKYFNSMTTDYQYLPSAAHYSCMVDLFGRAGCFGEAYQLIQSMPMEPHAGIWGSLLSACRLHCKVVLAEIAAERLFELEPHNSGNYILLSNTYAASRQWSNVSQQEATKRKGLISYRACNPVMITALEDVDSKGCRGWSSGRPSEYDILVASCLDQLPV